MGAKLPYTKARTYLVLLHVILVCQHTIQGPEFQALDMAEVAVAVEVVTRVLAFLIHLPVLST